MAKEATIIDAMASFINENNIENSPCRATDAGVPIADAAADGVAE